MPITLRIILSVVFTSFYAIKMKPIIPYIVNRNSIYIYRILSKLCFIKLTVRHINQYKYIYIHYIYIYIPKSLNLDYCYALANNDVIPPS